MLYEVITLRKLSIHYEQARRLLDRIYAAQRMTKVITHIEEAFRLFDTRMLRSIFARPPKELKLLLSAPNLSASSKHLQEREALHHSDVVAEKYADVINSYRMQMGTVITSYSIHYTKLYDAVRIDHVCIFLSYNVRMMQCLALL